MSTETMLAVSRENQRAEKNTVAQVQLYKFLVTLILIKPLRPIHSVWLATCADNAKALAAKSLQERQPGVKIISRHAIHLNTVLSLGIGIEEI